MEQIAQVHNKYRCEECKLGFTNLKDYIEHLDTHKQIIEMEENKPKRTLFQRIFGLNKEVVEMSKEEKVEEKVEEVKASQDSTASNEVNARMDKVEGAISNLTKLVTGLADKIVDAETKVETIPEEPEEEAEIVFSVSVPQSKSGDFLKNVMSKKYKIGEIKVVE